MNNDSKIMESTMVDTLEPETELSESCVVGPDERTSGR